MTHPIQAAHDEMVRRLSGFTVPWINNAVPSTDEFEAIRTYLTDVARIVDACILEVGREVSANATTNVNLKLFTNVLDDALTGEALFEIERVVEVMREDAMDDA